MPLPLQKKTFELHARGTDLHKLGGSRLASAALCCEVIAHVSLRVYQPPGFLHGARK